MSLSIYSKTSVDSLLSAKLGDAPSDGNEYVRKNAAWAIATGGGGGVAWGSITGTVTSQTDLTSYLSSNYLGLSGGTLSGSVTVPSIVLTYGGAGSITFQDGSVQTSAAAGGMDYNAALYAGTCAYLGGSFVSFDGTSTFTFNFGSGVPVGGNYFVLNSNIGITQDASTYYLLDTPVSAGVFQSSTFTGNFNPSNNIYLAFKDSTGAWHWCSNCLLYTS